MTKEKTTFTTTDSIKTEDKATAKRQGSPTDEEKDIAKREKKDREKLKIRLLLTLASTIVCGIAAFSSKGETGPGCFTFLMILIWYNN